MLTGDCVLWDGRVGRDAGTRTTAPAAEETGVVGMKGRYWGCIHNGGYRFWMNRVPRTVGG